MKLRIVNYTADSYKIQYKRFLCWHDILDMPIFAELFRDDTGDVGPFIPLTFRYFSDAEQQLSAFDTWEKIRAYHGRLKERVKVINERKALLIESKKRNKVYKF